MESAARRAETERLLADLDEGLDAFEDEIFLKTSSASSPASQWEPRKRAYPALSNSIALVRNAVSCAASLSPTAPNSASRSVSQ